MADKQQHLVTFCCSYGGFNPLLRAAPCWWLQQTEARWTLKLRWDSFCRMPATIPDAEVLRFTRQHESPTVFLVSSPRLADRSVFCVCLWVCACARQKEKDGGGGAEANSPLSVGLCVRCFQQQANWFCTYCERKLWVFRVLSPLNALLLLLHSWGEWGKMEQGMLFKSQTSKRGGDGVRVCVCVRARESKHDTTVDCLIPFVFILFF